MNTTSLTVGQALSAAGPVALAFDEMWRALWTQDRLPPPLLELCRLRLARLHGAEMDLTARNPAVPDVAECRRNAVVSGQYANDRAFDPGEVAVLELAEVYAQDPAAITDEMAAAVQLHFGDAGYVVLLESLGFIDGRIRMARLANVLACSAM